MLYLRLLAAGSVCVFAALAAPKPLSSYNPQIRKLLARMTLDEKIGQMTQADQQFLKDPADIETYFLGSLLSGGDSDPKAGNSFEAWTDMVEGYQRHALKTRLHIPLLYGVDAVHGHNNVLGAVVFPHNIGMGCTRNAALVEKAARITAEEVRATGINWVFAPCVTVPRDIRWGRTYEGFGEEPELAKSLGEAAVRGFQGSRLSDPLSVLACAKHFAGDGGTTFGTGKPKPGNQGRYPLDQGDTRLSEADLRRIHMQGYFSTVAAGVGSVMPSFSSWNGEKCSGNKRLLTEILKREMRFNGFLISDYAAIDDLPGDYKAQIERSINAGMDMVMVPNRYREFFTNLKELVQEGRVPMARVDDAVTRILRAKFALGLMDDARPPFPDRRLRESFGSAAHRETARECVRQSLVLLKNENHTLPVPPAARRIHVAGRSADNIGNQCGGWTIDWQGRTGAVTAGGTTILAGIRKAAGAAQVTYSEDGAGAAGADLAIVVIGETPYAEWQGDREHLALAPEDVAAVRNAAEAKVPVAVVIISGRPLIVNDILPQASALVAAWLPGTEGDGVADVLFGKSKPTGKLSFSWPRSLAQVTVHRGDPGYDPLFPYGSGLTY